ncbi:MAG TPA: type II secretion system F family protein [Thermoanaerobaculia bacterium]|nr:type II secretion system F family protein [Thermoanaerobaculia bacterium]
MTWLLVAVFFWAATAVALYWFYYEWGSRWIRGFNERHAVTLARFLLHEREEVAASRVQRVLVGIEIALFLIGLLVSRHPLFGLWALGLGLFGIHYFGEFLKHRETERFDDQMVDIAFAFRNSLKAGMSLQQTMQMIAADFQPPASEQFRMATREIQVGASIEEALQHLVERVPNRDLKMMVGSIEILRQTGGNMVETFEGVAETLKNRKRVEGKIKTLTAQGRYQTIMLCAMPFVMLLILYFMNRSYVEILFSTFLGWCVLSLVVMLVATGWVVIRKITTIEV